MSASLQETARERGIDSWVLASCARLQSPARRPPRSPGTALVHSQVPHVTAILGEGGRLDIILDGSVNKRA